MLHKPRLFLTVVAVLTAPLAIGCLDDNAQPRAITVPLPDGGLRPPSTDAEPPPIVTPDAGPDGSSIPLRSGLHIGPGGVSASSAHYKLITSTNEGNRSIGKSPHYTYNGGFVTDTK